MTIQQTLEILKFKKIGHYYLVNGEVSCNYTVKKTQCLVIVYAFVLGENIKYFGKSTRGYIRPLSYHKNDIMKTVRKGITDSCMNSQEVSIFARTEDLTIEFEGLELNVAESLEQALIKKFKPTWNNHIQK